MFQLDLRVVSTLFCDNNGHDTWINPANDKKFQVDNFLVPWIQSKIVKDIKKKYYGVPSDHCALLLTLYINVEKKHKYNTTNTNIPKQ
jgi:hypothetical protein